MRLGVLHYFPGLEAHHIPDDIDAFACIAPWELGNLPPAWEHTWQHPKFRQLWTPSEYSRRLFLGSTSLQPTQVRVLPNGVDTTVFTQDGERWETHGEYTRFLFVGGLIWRKGIDLLQRAWETAFTPADPVRLYIKSVGKGTYYRDSGLGDWQQKHAYVREIDEELTPAEMAALYRSVDVLVAPSRAEAFCLPVLEAMSCGKPVLVPSAGPTEEYVDDTCAIRSRTRWRQNDAGMYYEIPVEELARTLRWCSEHKDAMKERGLAARQKALAYDWKEVATMYAQVIKEITG